MRCEDPTVAKTKAAALLKRPPLSSVTKTKSNPRANEVCLWGSPLKLVALVAPERHRSLTRGHGLLGKEKNRKKKNRKAGAALDRWVIGQNAELPASSRSPGPLGRLGKLPSSRPRVTTLAPGPLGLSGQSTDLSSRGLNHWALGRVTELESPDLGTPLPNDKGRRIAPGGRRVSRNVGVKGNVGSARGLGRGTVCSPEFLRDDRGGRRRLYRISGPAAGARCRACGPKGPQGEATDGVWKCPSSGPPSTQRGADGSSTFTKSPLPVPTWQREHSKNF